MEPLIAAALIAMAGVGLTAVGAYAGIRAQQRTERHKVEAAAFDRAEKLYHGALKALQDQLDELRTDWQREREEMDRLRTRIRSLSRQAERERTRVEILREHIRELRDVIRRAGITPPPAPADSDIEDSGEHLAVVSPA